MPTRQQIRRDQIILALVERLEHKEISEKLRIFKDLKAKCAEIRKYLKNPGVASNPYGGYLGGWPDLTDAMNSGDIDVIRNPIINIANSLNYEITVLRAIDEARSHNKPINKKRLTEELSYSNALERNAIVGLKKIFSNPLFIKVRPQGEKLKPGIIRLLNAYSKIYNKSFKKTLALLRNLN